MQPVVNFGVPLSNSDLSKLGRKNPRNFAAMNEATVLAMAQRAFGQRFTNKAVAVAMLKTLPIPVQHALPKSAAQADAKHARGE